MKRFFGWVFCLISLSACASHHKPIHRDPAPIATIGAAMSTFAPDIQRAFTYDTSGDRRLDRDEWLTAQWTIFAAEHDLNRDGVVTLSEYRQSACDKARDYAQGNTFHDMCMRIAGKDEFDKRPQLDRAVYRRRSDQWFTKNDVNRDGYVTPEEMASQSPAQSSRQHEIKTKVWLFAKP